MPAGCPRGTDLILGLMDQRRASGLCRQQRDAERIPAQQPFPQLPAELLHPHAALLERKRDQGTFRTCRKGSSVLQHNAVLALCSSSYPNFRNKRHATTPKQTTSPLLSKRSYQLSLQATPTITIIERKTFLLYLISALRWFCRSSPAQHLQLRVSGTSQRPPERKGGWRSFLMAFLKER